MIKWDTKKDTANYSININIKKASLIRYLNSTINNR